MFIKHDKIIVMQLDINSTKTYLSISLNSFPLLTNSILPQILVMKSFNGCQGNFSYTLVRRNLGMMHRWWLPKNPEFLIFA